VTSGARRKLPLWAETIVLLVVAVVLALVIKTFFVQAFYIPSSSMRPGLVVNDRILVEKPSYWFSGTPERGDVVVFEDPGDWLGPSEDSGPTSLPTRALSAIGLYPSGGHLVKRVIGVEGDVIRCCDEQGRLEINGEPVDESGFIAPQRLCDGPMPGGGSCRWEAGPVPEGSLFVMGDNRSASADSSVRLCVRPGGDCDESDAYVDDDLVVGKVFALAWPPSHARFVSRPDAFADVPAPSAAE
jgi:signal peptidase I